MHLVPQKPRSATPCTGRLAAALAAVLALGAAHAADKGPRAHAEGKYDTVTATYVVVEGDDLFAISERFEVPVETLREHNKMVSDAIKPGQKLGLGKAAAHKSPAHQAAAKKPMSKMTCEEFLGLEDDYQPKAVYWAVAYGSKGQPEAEVVGVDGVETVTPFVIEECKKAPKESFWQKVKAQWAKLAAKM